MGKKSGAPTYPAKLRHVGKLHYTRYYGEKNDRRNDHFERVQIHCVYRDQDVRIKHVVNAHKTEK